MEIVDICFIANVHHSIPSIYMLMLKLEWSYLEYLCNIRCFPWIRNTCTYLYVQVENIISHVMVFLYIYIYIYIYNSRHIYISRHKNTKNNYAFDPDSWYVHKTTWKLVEKRPIILPKHAKLLTLCDTKSIWNIMTDLLISCRITYIPFFLNY